MLLMQHLEPEEIKTAPRKFVNGAKVLQRGRSPASSRGYARFRRLPLSVPPQREPQRAVVARLGRPQRGKIGGRRRRISSQLISPAGDLPHLWPRDAGSPVANSTYDLFVRFAPGNKKLHPFVS